jgi:thiol-disulfide isomerase/thioredoxin
MKMMKKTLLFVCLFFMASNMAIAAGIKFQPLTLKEALLKAKKEGKHVFIDVYATWCGPCKYLSNNVFVDDALGQFMNEHFVSIKLDGEKGDGTFVMTEYELNSYPTMLFLSPENVLVKKIVGAVSSEEILDGSNAVIFPESTQIFKLTQKYESGNREKEFLKEFIAEMLNQDIDTEPFVKDYLSLFPELALEDENEFLIFCLGISDLENKFSKEFLQNPTKYHELFPDMVETKIKIMLIALVEDARKTEDLMIIEKGVDLLLNPFNEIFGADTYARQELIDELTEIYNEE